MGVDPVQFGLDETKEEVVRGEKYLENQSLQVQDKVLMRAWPDMDVEIKEQIRAQRKRLDLSNGQFYGLTEREESVTCEPEAASLGSQKNSGSNGRFGVV